MSFDDDLKKRMALAKQQGWSDEEINRSALIERGLNRQKQVQQQQQQAQVQQKKQGATGLKGFALDIIPFGRVAEKAFTGRAGDITAGEVGTEALLTALPFGLGRAAKGARAAKAAVTGTKAVTRAAARPAQQAGGTLAERAMAPVPVGSVSRPALRTSTIAPNSKLNSAGEQDELINLARRTPALRGSGRRKFQNVEGEIGRLADEVDQLFSSVKTTTPAKTFQGGINTVRKEIVDPNEKKRFNIEFQRAVGQAFGGKLPQQLTATDVNTLRRAVNKQMTGIYKKVEAGTTLTDKDTAFLRLKDSLDDQLTGLAPTGVRGQVRSLNKDMNTLIKGAPEFKRLAEKRTMPLGLDIPFVSETIPQVVQSGADLTGRVMTNRLARGAGAQAGVRLGADAFGVRGNKQPDQNELPQEMGLAFPDAQSEDELILNEVLGQGVNDFDTLAATLSGGAPSGQQSGLPTDQGGMDYSSAELFNSAMQALKAGDTKGANQLADFAELASKFETAAAKSGKGGGAGGPNVTKVTAQQYGLAQSGSQATQQLAQLLQKDPNVLNRSATPGRSLPVVGGYISNAAGTGDFDAIGYNIADTILRLRTGATANESEVRKLQSQIMPRAGDSAQTRATKIQQIESIFGNVLDLAGQGGGSSSGLPDELEQLMLAGAY